MSWALELQSRIVVFLRSSGHQETSVRANGVRCELQSKIVHSRVTLRVDRTPFNDYVMGPRIVVLV